MSVETLKINDYCSVGTAHKVETRLVMMPKQVLQTLKLWMQRQRKRSDLARLDDRILEDIGLSRTDIEREIKKPFWVK
ncbi:hypothetical protein MTBPR1_40127 [Candidatus Terasakiella magnetica]|uniref:YjiS-like domain-containing protein n=1 Tax=Candidatus Terasakiella magnetica TaxID=1867952 RepID=A0A1C3RIR4_9PROT|nr:DUF1127 domain-containing protein [Candidatus Terasakiella magnetica]SCA57104.1 hypothetical protein MTBPR1_40127 [Candidatus Terasakiella magnetica]